MTTLVRSTNFRYPVMVLALAFFALTTSALLSRTVFDRLPHLEDELAYLFQAQVFARGDWAAPLQTPANAFWQPFTIDYPNGQRFSKYTPGWSALLAVGVANGAGWWVNAVFAALNVALVYRLAREIFGRGVGLFAAALLAFSPMALLLNATLMNHTAALTFTLLFMWANWRMSRISLTSNPSSDRAHKESPAMLSPTPLRLRERGNEGLRGALLYGALAGVALGAIVTLRPLTAAGIAAPFILWHGLRVMRALFMRQAFGRTLAPLLMLSAFTLLISAAIPLYNAATTGDPFKNLYTLIPGWEYDRVGFGEGFGRNGHTIEKGVAHMRYDLSLTAADLFGWQLGTFTPEPLEAANSRVADYERDCNRIEQSQATLQEHLRSCSGYYPLVGISWLLLIPGLLAGFRRNWAWGWAIVGVAWLLWLPDAFPQRVGAWLIVGALWSLAPLMYVFPRAEREPRALWTWLMLAVMVSLIAVHLAYWVGSQRYSTRYYFEALGAAAIISALALDWLRREANSRALRAALLITFAALCLWSFTQYSLPRINALYGYNRVSQSFIDTVNARRVTDAPLLVLMSGQNRVWRSGGALLAVSSPYLDSDIVFAWYIDATARAQLIAQMPEREIIEMRADGEVVWFADDCPTGMGCVAANDPARPLR